MQRLAAPCVPLMHGKSSLVQRCTALRRLVVSAELSSKQKKSIRALAQQLQAERKLNTMQASLKFC